jgi:hypothetical protein
MLDHNARSYLDIARAFVGEAVGNLTRDEVLDNITPTLVTNTGGLLRSPLLGEHPRLLRRQGRHGPGRRQRFPERALSCAAELDRPGHPNLIYFN